MTDIDWVRLWLPETPVLEIVIRGTAMYLGLFVLLRLVLKRQSGSVGITDLLVVVLLADAAQNGMADDYQSIPDGLILVATIVGWSYALDWLGYRFPTLQRFLNPPLLLLIKDGVLQQRNMRKELITEAELMGQLREQGVDGFERVKCAFMESDGQISVVPVEENNKPTNSQRRNPVG
jgi:uncharacterized membrane protein YcaP (DUF421 family)